MIRTAASALAVVAVLSLLVPLGHADRCILPITDVDVYGPGQKAIIAWNGEVERLILSTDLYATADTKALEVLPLPSEPSVFEGSFKSFEAVQQLMKNNIPRVLAPGKVPPGIEIVFHERIGAHDVTVVKAISIDELFSFIESYAKKMGITSAPPIGRETRSILEDYLMRGMNYWVFDLVDLKPSRGSIQPIVYQFQSASLYYPLKVSATTKGYTEVILYLITPQAINEEHISAKMRFARYEPVNRSVQFELSSNELSTIDPTLPELFPAADGPAAWFTAVKYEGETSALDFDFQISPRPASCRSIEVNMDRNMYSFGETVMISVHFTHLLPECAEIAVLHSHQIRLEIHDIKGLRVQYWGWRTDGDLSVCHLET